MRRTHPDAIAVVLLVLSVVVGGCTGRAAKAFLAQHDDGKLMDSLHGRYLLVHADGQALNQRLEVLSEHDARQWRRDILKRLDQDLATLTQRSDCPPDSDGHRSLRILVFAHGGLNSYDDGTEKMAAYLTETPPPAYVAPPEGPARTDILRSACLSSIVISWNSEAFSSIYDDLVGLRNGERRRTRLGQVWHWATAPFLLASRLASALGDLPVALGHGLERTFRGAKDAVDETHESAARATTDVATHAPWGLAHFVTTPVLEGLGTQAWAIMKRRAELAVAARLPTSNGAPMALPYRSGPVRQPCIQQITWADEIDGPKPSTTPEEDPQTAGAAAALFRVLGLYLSCRQEQYLNGESGAVDVGVTLVGHSMGSVLLDRLVALYGDILPIREIVYLAPAASIDDVAYTALAYLYRRELGHAVALQMFRRQRQVLEAGLAQSVGARAITVQEMFDTQEQRFCKRLGRDPMPHLWIFTLNARDETREITSWWLRVVPRGSLLEWVDGYFQPNKTTGQRTSGRSDNVKQYSGPVDQRLPFVRGPEPTPNEDRRAKLERECGETWLNLQNPADSPRSQGFGLNDFASVEMHLPGIDDWRIHVFRALRELDGNTAPGKHGDFSAPRFLGQILCRVDRTLFPRGFCEVSQPEAAATDPRPARVLDYWPRLQRRSQD